MLSGRPTLHTLQGARELEPGDAVVCPRGRRGAHRLENATGESLRFVIVSTMLMPEVVGVPGARRGLHDDRAAVHEGTHDPEEHGRMLRVFERSAGRPVPPDA